MLLPPSVHGLAQINALVVHVSVFNRSLELSTLPMRASKDLDELDRFSFAKLFRLASFICELMLRTARFRPDAVYFSPVPAGMGFFTDAVLMLWSRLVARQRLYHIHGMGVAQNGRCWRGQC